MKTSGTSWDVLIFGGGIAGLGTALALAKKGKRVLVFERQGLQGAASPRAAGILNPVLGLEIGHPLLPLTLEAFRLFPKWVREIEKQSGVNVEFAKTGVLYVARSPEEVKELRARYQWQRKTSLKVQWMEVRELARLVPELSPDVRAGIFYPQVSKIHPSKMMAAVTRYAARLGVKMIRTPLPLNLQRKSGGGFRVICRGRRYEAACAVNAAGSWSRTSRLFGANLPVKPARGQILILRGRDRLKTILHSVREGYLVPWKGGLFLAGSTVEFSGFRAAVTPDGRRGILRGLERIYPSVAKMKTVRTWAGLRPFSEGQLPILGPHPEIPDLFIATGYFRSGILLGHFLGEQLAQGICTGKMPPQAAFMSPRRRIAKSCSGGLR